VPTSGGTPRDGTTTTLAVAIEDALRSLGGEGTVQDVVTVIESAHPGRWKIGSISTTMADLTFPGSPSSAYPPHRRILERVSSGRYRCR
jgi:hypothetical protein